MRDPDTIEREIAAERERLSESLRALDARLSPEAIVQSAADRLRGPASGASEVMRDNPLALALIGSGVAWLVASASRHDDGVPKRPPPPPPPPTTGVASRGPTAADHDPRVKETSPGPTGPDPAATFDERVAAADAAIRKSYSEGDDIMSMTGTGIHDPHDTHFGAEPGRRARLKQTARELRGRLYDGLDNLPDGAKARILDARLKAIEAQNAIEARIARHSDDVRRGAHENPLLVGAIAFGIGAAIAAALPRTSVENRTLGARRDQFIDEADRVFREETSKLRRVAEAAVEEGKEAVKDTLRSGPPTEDDPVERVHQTAKREAKREGVGQVG
jgi:hypothetical protein